MLWVDNLFLTEGVRVQRKQVFTYNPLNLSEIKVLNSSLENCYVNGLENTAISEKIFPSRIKEHQLEQLQKYKGVGYEYLKFELNGYIGNPK